MACDIKAWHPRRPRQTMEHCIIAQQSEYCGQPNTSLPSDCSKDGSSHLCCTKSCGRTSCVKPSMIITITLPAVEGWFAAFEDNLLAGTNKELQDLTNRVTNTYGTDSSVDKLWSGSTAKQTSTWRGDNSKRSASLSKEWSDGHSTGPHYYTSLSRPVS